MKHGLLSKVAVVAMAVVALQGEDIQDYGVTNFGLSRPKPAVVASLTRNHERISDHDHANKEEKEHPMAAPLVVMAPSSPKTESSKMVVDVEGNSELGQLVRQIKEELSEATKQRVADLEKAKKLVKELEGYKKQVASVKAKNVTLTKKVAALNGKLHRALKEKEAMSSQATHAPATEAANGSVHEQGGNGEKMASRVPQEGGIDLFEECPPETKKEAAKADPHAKAPAKTKADSHAPASKPKADAHPAPAH